MPKKTKSHRPYEEQVELKAGMKLKRYSAKEVADLVGLSSGYVTLLLNGYSFSSTALVKIGKIVGAKPRL